MTLKDAVKNQDWDRIEYRLEFPEELGSGDTFYGECRYKDGELISLDGEFYSLEDEIARFRVAGSPEIGGLATLIVYVSWDPYKVRV